MTHACPTLAPQSETETCTMLHEYIEGKTATHEFEDANACLGAEATRTWKFHPDMGEVAISQGASEVSRFKTPLKAPACPLLSRPWLLPSISTTLNPRAHLIPLSLSCR